MNNEKACIVFTIGMQAEAQSIIHQLSEEGFDVCTAVAEQQIVEAAQAEGPVPDHIKSCIDNAAICFFLIPELGHECLAAAAGHAGASGRNIVAVAENVDALPEIFDDIAGSVLNIDSPQLKQVMEGKRVWERPDGSPRPTRDIDRVKCQ